MIPWMSDHEAIVFNLNVGSKPVIEDTKQLIFQYHKANVEGLKSELLDFQISFWFQIHIQTSVEANWVSFKHAMYQ